MWALKAVLPPNAATRWGRAFLKAIATPSSPSGSMAAVAVSTSASVAVGATVYAPPLIQRHLRRRTVWDDRTRRAFDNLPGDRDRGITLLETHRPAAAVGDRRNDGSIQELRGELS